MFNSKNLSPRKYLYFRDFKGFFDPLLQLGYLAFLLRHTAPKIDQISTYNLEEPCKKLNISKQGLQITNSRNLDLQKYLYFRDFKGFFDPLLQPGYLAFLLPSTAPKMVHGMTDTEQCLFRGKRFVESSGTNRSTMALCAGMETATARPRGI